MIFTSIQSVLEFYKNYPWDLPRESDLVCRLVTDLKSAANGARARFKLVNKTKKTYIQESVFKTSPVRTEVKVLGGERCDVSVLNVSEDHVCTFYVGGYGVRDVVLRVDPGDVRGYVEVKLYPGIYRPKRNGSQQVAWVDDLVKLHNMTNVEHDQLMALVFVDTSLLVTTMNLDSRSTAAVASAGAVQIPNKQGGIPRLLCRKKSYKFEYIQSGVEVTLEPHDYDKDSSDPESGVFLWAFGVDCCGEAGVDYETVFDMENVHVCCWKVSIKPTSQKRRPADSSDL